MLGERSRDVAGRTIASAAKRVAGLAAVGLARPAYPNWALSAFRMARVPPSSLHNRYYTCLAAFRQPPELAPCRRTAQRASGRDSYRACLFVPVITAS